MQVNVHEAKTQLSRLLELVEQGQNITIARHGKPVAELTRVRRNGFQLGMGKEDAPIVPPGDEWWQPMTDEEAEAWIAGK